MGQKSDKRAGGSYYRAYIGEGVSGDKFLTAWFQSIGLMQGAGGKEV
jgi:hypothetical protein